MNTKNTSAFIESEQYGKKKKTMKKAKSKKKVPSGMHPMPNGKMMKDSEMKKKMNKKMGY